MPEWLKDSLDHWEPNSLPVLLVSLSAAFALGCVVAAIHWLTAGKTGKPDYSFLATLVMLSVLIALVTMVIGGSVARAFSLAGALSIIRFRTVVEDTRDTAFVIFAVVAGMSAGTNHMMGPIVCAPLILLAAWVLRPRRDTGPGEGTLILRLAAARPTDERVEALLKQFLPAHRLSGVSTARGGAAIDATYIIQLPPPEQVLLLMNELGRVEGVQGVELKGG